MIAAAYRLFVDRGFAEVSMEQIAEAADVSRRSVYNKFLSKADLYRAALDPVFDRLAAIASVAPYASDEPCELLHRYASVMRQLMAIPEMIDVMRVVVHDGESQRWLSETYLEKIRKPIRSSFTADVERLISLGKLPAGDPGDLCEQFFGATLGLLAFPRLLQLDPEAAEPADDFLRPTVDSLLLGWKAAA